MALNARTRRKHVEAAAKRLPGTTQVVGYGRGFAGVYPPTAVAGLLLAVVVLSGLVSWLLGVVFFPGIIVIAALVQVVKPPRGLVVAPEGLAVFSNSFWTGKPTGAPLLLPFGSFVALAQRGRYLHIQAGPEQVWIPNDEMVHLGNVVTSGVVGVATPTAQPGLHRPPPGAAVLPQAAVSQVGPSHVPASYAPDPQPGGSGIELPGGVEPLTFEEFDGDEAAPRSPILPEEAKPRSAAPPTSPPPPPAPRPPSSGIR